MRIVSTSKPVSMTLRGLNWNSQAGSHNLLTHPVTGLENYQEMISTLTTEKNAIKVFVNVTPH